MAKDKLVIGGYRVPGGWGGIMVRRACELVTERPGIKQVDLLRESCEYAGLNLGTAGWLTSPTSRDVPVPLSPAEILWDRRSPAKGRGLECFPNELTSQCLGASRAAQELWVSDERKKIVQHADLKAGALCILRDRYSGADADRTTEVFATFLGWQRRTGAYSTADGSNVVHKTLDELLDPNAPYVMKTYALPVFTDGSNVLVDNLRYFNKPFNGGPYFTLEVVKGV